MISVTFILEWYFIAEKENNMKIYFVLYLE